MTDKTNEQALPELLAWRWPGGHWQDGGPSNRERDELFRAGKEPEYAYSAALRAQPSVQGPKLERCPDGCYRPMARNADDCAAGCCSKWYAPLDGEASDECAKLAAFWATPPESGGQGEAVYQYRVRSLAGWSPWYEVHLDGYERAKRGEALYGFTQEATETRILYTHPPAPAIGAVTDASGWARTKLREHEAACETCGRAVWDGKDWSDRIGFLATCGKRVARIEDCGTVDCVEALTQGGGNGR